MEYEQWLEIIRPYSYAVEELKIKFRNVRNDYLDTKQHSPVEFVTGRTKKLSSALAKMKKLDIDNIEDIEDLAGIRIMCQFVEDIYVLVDIIKERNDMSIVLEKDYINNAKESGYRSYHLIVKYPVNTIHGVKEVQCEIQIRTLSMNFWATIEHSLKYKYDHYIPDELAHRLKEYVLTDIYSRVNKLKELGDGENYYLYRMKMNEISRSRNIKSLLVLKE